MMETLRKGRDYFRQRRVVATAASDAEKISWYNVGERRKKSTNTAF